MSEKAFKTGDEVFYVSGRIVRGTVKEVKLYGFDVKTQSGQEFFSALSTYTKQQAYDECVELVQYFTNKANELLSEIEDAETAETESDEDSDDENPYLLRGPELSRTVAARLQGNP